MSKPQQNDPAQMFQQILQQMTQGGANDGGVDWFPTETIRPTESLHHVELLV